MLIKDLYAMVQRVRDDDVFLHAQTETVRRAELTQTSARISNLAPTIIIYLYNANATGLCQCYSSHPHCNKLCKRYCCYSTNKCLPSSDICTR